MAIKFLMDNTSESIKDLLIDKNESVTVVSVLDNCTKELDVLIDKVKLTPQLYNQREKLLTEVSDKTYKELDSKVSDTLWLKINLIGFVYQYFYEKL